MKALVIGGGIGGLAAGVALKQIGHEVSVFERAHELGEVGSGISLWSNGVNALKELKVDDALRQLSRPGVVEGSRPADGARTKAIYIVWVLSREGSSTQLDVA